MFHVTQDELSIRPVWHQKRGRVQTPRRRCFPAYGLWKPLAQWMRGVGRDDAPRTRVEEITQIKSGDVVLKARHIDGRGPPSGYAA